MKALRLTRQKIYELMEEDPTLAQHFSAHIISRLKLLAKDLKAIDTAADDATISPQLPQMSADLTNQRTRELTNNWQCGQSLDWVATHGTELMRIWGQNWGA